MKDKMSFGDPALDIPLQFVDKYVMCYLKHCISGIGYVAGIFAGIRKIEGDGYACFEAEEGHDFLVPVSNVAYYRLMSEEAVKKQQEEHKKKMEHVERKEEQSIKDEIENKMNQVQEQLSHADQSTSSGNPEREEAGDSEFVFKM